MYTEFHVKLNERFIAIYSRVLIWMAGAGRGLSLGCLGIDALLIFQYLLQHFSF